MDNSFDIIDIAIVIGICQGLFLSLTLQRINNNNAKANSILSILIGIATIMLIGRFLFFRFLTEWIYQWSLLFDALIFLFGPFLFLYTRRLLFHTESSKLSVYHFVPFMAMLALAISYIVVFTPAEYVAEAQSGKLNTMYNCVIAAGIFSNAYYLAHSLLLVKMYHAKEKDTISYVQSPVKYLYVFHISIALVVVVWSFGFINSFFLNRYFQYLGYDTIWIVIPIFIYVIGYFSLKQPELFRIHLEKSNKKWKARLTPSEITILKEKLDSLMLNEKVYLQSDLTLREVAETLQTSTNNISWLLNNVYKSTFYDFINNYRIKEFVQKVENKEHLQHTILALSMDVGFNSKSTFNKAFKTAMNDTPSNYIKTLPAA